MINTEFEPPTLGNNVVRRIFLLSWGTGGEGIFFAGGGWKRVGRRALEISDKNQLKRIAISIHDDEIVIPASAPY